LKQTLLFDFSSKPKHFIVEASTTQFNSRGKPKTGRGRTPTYLTGPELKEALPDLEFLTNHQAPKDRQQQFIEALANVLGRHPEKFEKFEQFILKL